MGCRYLIIFALVQIAFATNNTDPPIVAVYTNGIPETMQLNCHVKSQMKPTIRWYKNSVLLNCSVPNICKVKSGHDEQSYWSNLTKSYVKTNEKYTCIAENPYGKSNDTVTMPCFEGACFHWKTTLQEDIKVFIGQSVAIKCQLLSLNQHIQQCYKFGINHNHSHNYSIENVSVTKPPRPGNKNWISYGLNITNISKTDGGVYTCYFKFTKKIKKSRCWIQQIPNRFHIIVSEQPSNERREKRSNLTIALAVSAGGVVAGFILALWIFCLRKKKVNRQRLYESEPELRWDVFVSYSSKDFDWVKELCKTLEQHPFNLTVCLHQRDWEVGRTILDNMAESIYCSHKTLLIVSKSYIESSFCMQELNIAMDCEFSARKIPKDRIILIKLDDVSLKNLPKALRQKSYLDFSNNEQRKHYKKKLLRALPRRDEMQAEPENEESDIVESDESDNAENENDIKLGVISNAADQVTL